jgi:hypothetical protein
MAGPTDTLGGRWPPFAMRPSTRLKSNATNFDFFPSFFTVAVCDYLIFLIVVV